VPVEEDEPEANEPDEEEEDRAPRKEPRRRASAKREGVWGKAVALWEEVHPEIRDLLFLSSGVLFILLLIFLGEVITGLRASYIAGLATGAAATYVVELFIRWRRDREVAAEPQEVGQ
jgi:hypothetical protein